MRRHLLIAGTGRSGTSFLVRYFSALGMGTHLDRAETWDDSAQAGLEDSILHGDSQPYVIKSPWIYEYIDQVLSRKDIAIDAVIVPIRDIVEASVSRVTVEMQDAHHKLPFIADELKMWENHAHTAGGVVFSLNPMDQARLLALGFHKLIEALTRAEVPICLVAFPRLVEDFEYLYRQLKPILPAGIDKEQARVAFDAIADKSKVRTSEELATRNNGKTAGWGYPSAESIELAALRRELKRLRSELAAKRPTAAAACVAVASEDYIFAAEIVPGRPIVQRIRRSDGLQGVAVQFVTYGREPSADPVLWQITARGNSGDVELGSGAIDAATVFDWARIDLPLSVVPENEHGEIEVCFSSSAAVAPIAPIGIPLYRALPDSLEAPAEIGGQPAPAGAQIGLILTYRHSST